MSGQQQRKFNTGPGYSDPSRTSPAPSARTEAFRPTAATVQSQGAGLAGIGAALGGFFNTAADAANRIDEINHQQDLVQIERENKALEWEASADQSSGRPANPEHMSRQAYAGTYQAAAADDHAHKMFAGLKVRMDSMKLDGSEDAEQIATDFFKTEIGQGTGNTEFDARMMYSYKRAADQLVVQQTEAVRQTVERNAWETVRTDVARQMTAGGVTTGQMADLQGRILTMSRGDQVVADKQIETILGEAIMNDGNARSALNALEELGYAKRNPDSYLRLSKTAFERTNAIKTWQAGQDVQKWRTDFDNARVKALEAGRAMAPAEILAFASSANAIDSKHGVGADKFAGHLTQAWARAVKSQAAVNLVEAAYFGQFNGVRDGGILASRFGESPGKLMSEHFDPAVAAIVAKSNASTGAYPNLAKTAEASGVLEPLKSPQAATEFATLLSSTGMQNAAPGGMSDTYKTQFANAILGTDPNKAATAFRFFKSYEDIAGPEMTQKLFGSTDAATRYLAAKRFAQGDQGVEGYFKRIIDNPLDEKDLVSEADGKFNWGRLTMKPEAKSQEVEADIMKRLGEKLREGVGRDAWFRAAPVALSRKDENEVYSMVAQHMRTQKQTAGSVDYKAAVDDVTAQIKSQFVTLPGQGRTLQLVRDPYGGRGREVDHPVAIHNGQPVYAGFKIKNRLGETEDPVATYRDDMTDMGKRLPGLTSPHGEAIDTDKVYLGKPNEVTGLHPIHLPSGVPLQIKPGQELAIPTKRSIAVESAAGGKRGPLTGHLEHPGMRPPVAQKGMGGAVVPAITETLKMMSGFGSPTGRAEWIENVKTVVPTDPAELKAFLEKNLPPGVFPVVGWTGPRGEVSYALSYGFRVKGDQQAVDKAIKDREAEIERRKHDPLRPQQLEATPVRNYRRGNAQAAAIILAQ